MTLDKATEQRRHAHVFDEGNPVGERRTFYAVILTALMMVAEIAGGYGFNSMALLADGWHMFSHALALGLSVLAYVFARKHANDGRFVFGTWKIEILGGFTSALFLVLIAALMLYQSMARLIAPTPIAYNEAIGVTIIGLLVNFICAWMLRDGHDHGHAHDSEASPVHNDVNLHAAYMHVIADAATSVLAVVALVCGKNWGIRWMDPLMGIIGAVMVVVWAFGLLRESGSILLNAESNDGLADAVRNCVAAGPYNARIADMHLWRVGRDRYACILSVVTPSDATPDQFKTLLSGHKELAHVTVEINRVG